jgi:predicted Zn-dependent protease
MPSRQAVLEANRLVEVFPREYDVYLFSLWSHRDFGENDRENLKSTLDIAERAIERFPQGLALRYAYAELLVGIGREHEAIEQLEFCVASDPSYTEAAEYLNEIKAR